MVGRLFNLFANGLMVAALQNLMGKAPRTMRVRRGIRITARQRRAGVVLELLLSLPVLLIALLAAIQFGILFGGLHQLSLASRIGARAAAESAGLPTNNGPVPADIVQAVGRQMSQLGINSFGVLVEHNVANPQPMNPILLSSGSPVPTPPSTSLPGSGQYVRVSVAVDLTEVMPDLLGFFGFNILGETVQKTTVYRYEL